MPPPPFSAISEPNIIHLHLRELAYCLCETPHCKIPHLQLWERSLGY